MNPLLAACLLRATHGFHLLLSENVYIHTVLLSLPLIKALTVLVSQELGSTEFTRGLTAEYQIKLLNLTQKLLGPSRRLLVRAQRLLLEVKLTTGQPAWPCREKGQKEAAGSGKKPTMRGLESTSLQKPNVIQGPFLEFGSLCGCRKCHSSDFEPYLYLVMSNSDVWK